MSWLYVVFYLSASALTGYLLLCLVERRRLLPGFSVLACSLALAFCLQPLFLYVYSIPFGLNPGALYALPVVVIVFFLASTRHGYSRARPLSWPRLFTRAGEAVAFFGILSTMEIMIATLYWRLPFPKIVDGLVEAFPAVHDLHKQMAFSGAIGSLGQGQTAIIDPFFYFERLRYYFFYYIPIYAIHEFCGISLNASFFLVTLLLSFLFMSLYYILAKSILKNCRAALLAFGLVTLVANLDLLMHRICGGDALTGKGLECWKWVNFLGFSMLGGRPMLNWYTYVPQHFSGGLSIILVLFLFTRCRLDFRLSIIIALLLGSLWGASFYVAAPVFIAVLLLAASVRFSQSLRKTFQDAGHSLASLRLMLVLTLALSFLLIANLVNVRRLAMETKADLLIQCLGIPFSLLISYPLNLGAAYLLGIWGLYRGWRTGAIKRSFPLILGLFILLTSALLAAAPNRTIDWKDNILLPAQLCLPLFAGLLITVPPRGRSRSRLARMGKAYLLLGGAVLTSIGLATTFVQFQRFRNAHMLSGDKYRLLEWIKYNTRPNSRFAVFDDAHDSLSFCIPVHGHRPVWAERDSGKVYCNSEELFQATLDVVEYLRTSLGLPGIHARLLALGADYLVVSKPFSFYAAYREQGFYLNVLRLFVPLYSTDEYCILKPRAATAGGRAPAPIRVELSNNLLPAFPDKISDWEVSCDGSASITQQAGGDRSTTPDSLFFSGDAHYHVKSRDALTLAKGASYVIEASIMAPRGDDYNYYIFFERVNDAGRIPLKVYEGDGHDWKAYRTLFTAPETVAVTLHVDMRCPAPQHTIGLKDVSLRTITLAGPDALSHTNISLAPDLPDYPDYQKKSE
jgi:hypothetical protein